MRTVVILIAIWLAFLPASSTASEGEQQRILIINSEGGVLPLVAEMNRGIGVAIKEQLGPRTEILVEWLDLTRFDHPERRAFLVETLRTKYKDQRLSGIIAVTYGALRFIGEQRETLFPDVPIVHMTLLEEWAREWNQRPGIYGASADYDLSPIVRLMETAHPKATRLIIITGTSPYDRTWQWFIQRWFTEHPTQFQTEFWDGLPIGEVTDRLGELDNQSLIFSPGLFRDGNGEWMLGAESLERMIQSANRPFYSIFSQRAAELGGVGGFGPDFRALGPQAVGILREVLEGRPPGPMAHRGPVKGFFHWGALQRWGIPESALPEGSTVIAVPPAFMDLYGHWVIAGGIVIAIQSGFIVALLWERRRRQQTEKALAENRAQLTHLARVSMLGELTGTLSHEFSQPLSIMTISAEAGKVLAAQEGASPRLCTLLDSILCAGHQAGALLGDLRRMVQPTPRTRERVDLGEQVREVIRLMHSELAVRQITRHLDLSPTPCLIDADPVQIRQVLLNLIYNACEAMEASPPASRQLTLAVGPDQNAKARLTLADTGGGMQPDQLERLFDPFFTTKPSGLGLGTAICRQIIHDHGGTLSAQNQGAGLAVTVQLPLLSAP